MKNVNALLSKTKIAVKKISFALFLMALVGCGDDLTGENKNSLREAAQEPLGTPGQDAFQNRNSSNLCNTEGKLQLVTDTYKNLCQNCHGANGEGSSFAPGLIGLEYNSFEKVVREGKNAMPAFSTDDLAQAALKEMFDQLQGEPCENEESGESEVVEETETSEGLNETEQSSQNSSDNFICELPEAPVAPESNLDYRVLCAGCHGSEAEGTDFAPGLADNYIAEDFLNILRQGRGSMPSFTSEVLDDASVEAIRQNIAALKLSQEERQTHQREVDQLLADPSCQRPDQEQAENTQDSYPFQSLALTCEEDQFHLSHKVRVITKREFINILEQTFSQNSLEIESVQSKLNLIPEDYQKAGFASYKENLSYIDTDVQLEAIIEIGFALTENATLFSQFFSKNNLTCDLGSGTSQDILNCKNELLNQFIPWLWGGSLTEEERESLEQSYASLSSDGNFTNAQALATLILSGFASHKFWYRGQYQSTVDANNSAMRQLTSEEFASRLALDLTGRLPDPQLWNAAGNNQLETDSQVSAHFERLFNTTFAKDQFESFTKEWLNLNYVQTPNSPDLTDAQRYDLVAGARTEMAEIVAEEVIEGGKIADLFTTNKIKIKNQTMADVYGLPIGDHLASDADRQGITTRIGLLVSQVQDQPSAIIRGHHIRTEILCDDIGDPPPTAPTEIPPVQDQDFFSSRQALENATSQPACSFCHNQINPLGLAFGNFDGLGKIRTEEWVEHKVTGEQISLAIDTNVTPKLDLDDDFNTASGAAELNQMLAKHDKPKACFGKKYYQFLTGEKEVEKKCSQTAFSTALIEGKSVKEALLGLILSKSYRSVSNQ